MNQNRTLGHLAMLACSLIVGCMTEGSIDPNAAPIANAGEDQMLPYDGSPVEVTLDGSKSEDEDGQITRYDWRSGNRGPDGGMAIVGPDPDNVARPKVTLEQGRWVFTLFVEDDKGDISRADSVEITVGDVEAKACVPDECPDPPLGVKCCTTPETGAEAGDPLGRGPGLCGTDLGAVVASLEGLCLQLGQPGEETSECPEIMGASPEPGCCTDEGLCASVNTSAGLGCHYPSDGPGMACGN